MAREGTAASGAGAARREVDLLVSVYDQLTPEQEQYLGKEDAAGEGFRGVLDLLGRTPYPLEQETAAALEAAAARFVLPWDVVRSRYLERWVYRHYRCDAVSPVLFGWDGPTPIPLGSEGVAGDNLDYIRACFTDEAEFDDFLGGQDFTHGLAGVRDEEFEALLEDVELAMADEAGRGAVTLGSCVRLECVPFDNGLLKLVPLVEVRWIDRHFLELAEWCAALVEQGYERLPARDPHPLAWERFYLPGTDWSAPEEAEEEALWEVRQQAARNLRSYPGRIRDVGGRPHLHIEDYLGWTGRKMRGEVSLRGATGVAEGVVVASWNAWVKGQEGGPTDLEGVTVEEMAHPRDLRRHGDVQVVVYRPSLARELATRKQALTALFTAFEAAAKAKKAAPLPFVPTELQRKIMAQLYRKQLTTEQLQNTLGVDRKQLFGDWGLRPLRKHGLVANNKDRKGYFRPDALPPLLGDDLEP